MTDAEQVEDACRQHGLRCYKCRLTAIVILHLLGLDRALAFVYRQRPH